MTSAIDIKQLLKDYPLIDRGDGRIEIICPHGVGHPSEVLSKLTDPGRWVDSWMRVHVCDGCCSWAIFAIAEQHHAARLRAKRGVTDG